MDNTIPTFPRQREGFTCIDKGERLNNERCPNCYSYSYYETVSIEYCPDCNLLVDYWGIICNGGNEIFKEYQERKWAEEEYERNRQSNDEGFWGDYYNMKDLDRPNEYWDTHD